MANSIKQSKGIQSQKDIVTKRRCPICRNLMRQNEIAAEMVFRHVRTPGQPRREMIIKHTKNCTVAAAA